MEEENLGEDQEVGTKKNKSVCNKKETVDISAWIHCAANQALTLTDFDIFLQIPEECEVCLAI